MTIAGALYVIGNLGGVGAWLTGPARVAFTIGLDRYFPPWFGRIHPKWKTPYVAILVAAGLATGFLILSVIGKGTTVEKAYLVLLDTMLLIYFVPFIYLFLTYIKVRLIEPAPAVMFPRDATRRRAGGSGRAVPHAVRDGGGDGAAYRDGKRASLRAQGGWRCLGFFSCWAACCYWRARWKVARVKIRADAVSPTRP